MRPSASYDYRVRRQALLTEEREAWLAQDNWPHDAARELMRAIWANDANGVRQARNVGADLTVKPPRFAGHRHAIGTAASWDEPASWLFHAVQAEAAAPAGEEGNPQAVQALLDAGANPAEVWAQRHGDTFTPVTLAFMQGDRALCEVFFNQVPGLSATAPQDPEGYGPLAAALIHVFSDTVIYDRTGAPQPGMADRAYLIASLLERGGDWTPASRLAVFRGAISGTTPALLPHLAAIGCRWEDTTVAERQTLLRTALTVHRLNADRPVQEAPEAARGWFTPLRGTPVPTELREGRDALHFSDSLKAFEAAQVAPLVAPQREPRRSPSPR
jgi:hypothetical protein